ncbi:gustatory receptor 68a isoform X2 [Teleopsis dalmanni]|uniref:gustatory receptor 68a isoform X2 n=1 Tax=Teleopsis dalmanni TaxID=139649 RepID=UPI0018CCB5B1|nr:gustatory receptor 68a isoform X2 [Teleopsis dalmanni]
MKIVRDINFIVRPTQACAILPQFRGTGDDFCVSKGGQLYGYFISFVLLISSVTFCVDVLFNASNFKILKNKHGDTEEINQTIETLFCIISYTMIVISCVYNSSKHCRTFKDIAKIDEYLEAGGFTGSYTCPFLAILISLISFGVVAVAFYYIHIRSEITSTEQCVLLTAYALQMLFAGVFALYLRVVLKNITRRIEFVNQKLDEFTKESAKENWRDLSNLIEIFCKFRYITENINSVTGVGLLFYIGYAFYTVTNQSYLAFSTLTTIHEQPKGQYNTMGLSIAWVLAEVMTMSIICSSCDSMSSEANTTSQILARVYGKSKEYQNIIDKFLTKSIKQDVQFTAYGFFVIDNSTLFKIFSAVTTYLVILIQFKQLEDSKMEDQIAAQT